jgi:membrane associated rhomboid family serine protease/Tfp pilus assembly protein PilF
MADSQPVLTYPPAEPAPPPRRYVPIATLVIILITIIVFGLQELAGGSQSTEVLLDFGGASRPYFHQGQWWRLVMPIFLHIGWMHILFNMYAFYILGPLLERVYGYGRFAFIYIISGIGSSYLSMKMSTGISAGASGAIAGVAGAMLATGFLHREVIPKRWRMIFGKLLVVIIVLEVLLDRTIPNIDNWGHLGGLVTGLILAGLIPPPHPAEFGASEQKPSQAWVWVPVLIVVLSMGQEFRFYRGTRVFANELRQGARLLAAHEENEAMERFKRAQALQPSDERPHEAMGSIYLDQKETADAVREYQEALRLSPGSPRAELGLALAYRQQGDLAKSQELFEKVFGKNPTTAEGQAALGDLLAERKLYSLAVEHYEAALKIQPNFAEAQNNLAWLYATCEDPKFRKPQEALQLAQRAVALSDWKEPAFIDTLAEALYVNQQYTAAVKVQTRALALEPDNQEYKDHMAKYQKAAGAKTLAG